MRHSVTTAILALAVFASALAPMPQRPVPLPLSRRTFRTGTTATTDATHNIAAAFELSTQVGTVTMLWVDPNGLGLYDALTRPNPGSGTTTYDALKRMGLVPVVNLNPWTVRQGVGIVRNDGSGQRKFDAPEFARALCREAEQIAARFRPRYFSIGNEINSVREHLGDEVFRELLALEKALYATIKSVSPDTKVLTVVSYSQLVDSGGKPHLELLREVSEVCDIMGLTTYPWRKYAKPADLPEDYYRRISKYVQKPIAFTEIGWSSDESQGGGEQEQAEFLIRFLRLTKGMRLEFVNWAFLHDLPEGAVTGFVVQRSHLGLGLRRFDGTPKPVWHCFRALALLPGP